MDSAGKVEEDPGRRPTQKWQTLAVFGPPLSQRDPQSRPHVDTNAACLEVIPTGKQGRATLVNVSDPGD